MEETLQLLLKIQKSIDFILIIGTDDLSPFTELEIDNNRIKLVNTSKKDDYHTTLTECDIIILNYEKSKYFYRCSGVAADAIGTKTFVLCPNFPLMNNQINYPTQVGISYENESDLETAIQQSLELVRNDFILFEEVILRLVQDNNLLVYLKLLRYFFSFLMNYHSNILSTRHFLCVITSVCFQNHFVAGQEDRRDTNFDRIFIPPN
jgi:hypothetical protein